jgi:N-acetylglucosaminyldiphosphoundecaprenol N-acetyl-beta-D-mannosaminyltransferase
VPQLCARAAEKGYSVFLLGAGPGVADKAAENLKQTYPGIRIAGTFSPSYGFEKNPEEVEKINAMLRASGADILILGVGVPKQEIFGYQNQEKYNIPVTINAGATIDFLAGNKKRAPKWMVDGGLEWLYRTIKEPKRVGSRVLRDLAVFPLAVKYKPKKR